jgi:cob(I)alamin adenosyltransferase
VNARPTKGLLVVYTGDGKGKTTAALGVVFRALGRGMKPAVVQFIKGKWKTGERTYAETIPGLVFFTMGRGFTWESEDISRDKRAAQEGWAEARRLMMSGEHEVVVLDELTYVLNYGFVPVDEVMEALAARPSHVHVIITGRSAPEPLVAAAELVTEMRNVRHPFEKGIPAQVGLDF